MISKLWKVMQNKKRNDKGAALVMVIIAIAFIGMLVGMVLYMAYCNYLMKANDTQAKDNFYSAEYALDVIHAGLQMDISEAMSEAYVMAMKDSAGKESADVELDFQQIFVTKMQQKLSYNDGVTVDLTKWSLDHLKNFWVKNGMAPASMAGETGPYLEAEGGDNLLTIADGNTYLTLSNLKIVYTDTKGFVSIITTDLRVKVPTIGFAQSATKMSVENFSLIANNALINDNNTNVQGTGGVSASGSDVRISGNVFGGYDGVYVGNTKRIRFVTNGEDKASGEDVTYRLIADSLNITNARDVGQGLYVEDSFETYVQDINLQTGRLDLDGYAYVGNDLDIGGKRSVVTLSGEYFGYGNTMDDADNSSSILINGGNTTLDFSDLEKLTLSGHAYVGASKYDADVDRLAYATDATNTDSVTSDKIEDEDAYNTKLNATDSTYADTDTSIPRNGNDLMMGESISIKANQLLYMVPAECVGYKISTGEQVVAKNPMTYQEYQMLTETQEEKKDAAGNTVTDTAGNAVMEDVYDPVRLSVLWNKLSGIAYTNDYKAVYRRVNGTVLVYLYLDFGSSETMANEFYKAYYNYDPEGINDYVTSYISDMQWSSSLGSANLSLAGNAFYINGSDEVVFIEDDLQDPTKYGNMLVKQATYTNTYESLMHSLSPDYDEMTSEQMTEQIFYSLVDENKLADLTGLEFKTSSGNIEARISKNSLVYPSSDCPANTKLIVAEGDIFINDDFEGLAIAGGNIYICPGCSSIDYNPQDVLQAMRALATSSTGETYYAYDIFGASGAVTYGVDGAGEQKEEKVELQDLIVYENWKKE